MQIAETNNNDNLDGTDDNNTDNNTNTNSR